MTVQTGTRFGPRQRGPRDDYLLDEGIDCRDYERRRPTTSPARRQHKTVTRINTSPNLGRSRRTVSADGTPGSRGIPGRESITTVTVTNKQPRTAIKLHGLTERYCRPCRPADVPVIHRRQGTSHGTESDRQSRTELRITIVYHQRR